MFLWRNKKKHLPIIPSYQKLFLLFFFQIVMDVRESLNAEDNLMLVTGEGAHSSIENDSFFARVPPQAASTVGRTKARSVPFSGLVNFANFIRTVEHSLRIIY